MQNTTYTPPNTNLWAGRKTDPSNPPEYWFEVIKHLDISQPEQDWPAANFALLGYACDEGVRRNQGRLGAVAGAGEVKRQCAKLANHLDNKVVADAGAITCTDENLEATQTAFGEAITRLLDQGIMPIGIGGGHDIAYAHFLGIDGYLSKFAGPKPRLGILNFDAHFDLRPFPNGPTSGTPFRQVLADHSYYVEYMAVGIQRAANVPSLFETAANLNVDCILHDACTPANIPSILHLLQSFFDRVDYLYITVDLDGFSSAYAPGVSAPSPVGFSPEFFFPILRKILATGKVISLDIAEMNPVFDQDGVTAKLAARIINEVAG